MALWDWLTSDKTVNIQNTNYVGIAFREMFARWNSANGFLTNSAYIPLLGKISLDNETVRIPGYYVTDQPSIRAAANNSDFNMAYWQDGQGILPSVAGNASLVNGIVDMPRMLPALKKVSDYRAETLTSTPNYWLLDYEFGTRPNVANHVEKILDISAYDDLYVIDTVKIYSADGTSLLSTYKANSLPYGNRYDTYIPFTMYKAGNEIGKMFMPYIQLVIPNTDTAAPFQPFEIRGNWLSPYKDIFKHIIAAPAPDFSPLYFCAGSVGTENLPTLTTYPNGTIYDFVAATKETWEKYFTSSGMPWSYIESEVTDPGGGGLIYPTTPGQPTNPVDDNPGTGDNISDPVEYPTLEYIPNSTVYDRYFLAPNQIVDIKKFLFSDTFIDNIKRIWTNPAEYVISLAYYPFDVDSTGIITTDTLVSIGGITSDVSALAATDSGIPYFYGGSIAVDNYYNSYLDYEPYTSIDIYIPYIGVRPLNVSQIVGHTLNIGYYIDFNTQQITALLGLDGGADNLGQVVTQYIGSIGVQTPLSGTSAQEVTRNIVAQTAGLITGVGAIAGGVATGNYVVAATGAAHTAGSLMGGHTAPSYYGSLSPISGLLSPQTAYLIINRPIAAEPEKFKEQVGYSSCYSSAGLGAFSGFLKCAAVDIPATSTMTDEEQEEIEQLLLGGIYI